MPVTSSKYLVRLRPLGCVEEVTDEPLYRDRVCGNDIGKAGMVATIRVPSDKNPAWQMAETRSFGTTKKEVLALADWLRCWQVPAVVMQATGDYWKARHAPPDRPPRQQARRPRLRRHTRTRTSRTRTSTTRMTHTAHRRPSRPDAQGPLPPAQPSPAQPSPGSVFVLAACEFLHKGFLRKPTS